MAREIMREMNAEIHRIVTKGVADAANNPPNQRQKAACTLFGNVQAAF